MTDITRTCSNCAYMAPRYESKTENPYAPFCVRNENILKPEYKPRRVEPEDCCENHTTREEIKNHNNLTLKIVSELFKNKS